MDNIWTIVIKGLIGLVGVFVGYLISILKMKWRQKEKRIDFYLKKRLILYSEGIGFANEVGENLHKKEELKQIFDKWKNWYYSNVMYFSPLISDTLLDAIALTWHMRGDARDGYSDTFFKKIEELKNLLKASKDIDWLPEILN